jgi:hypothetical protein
MDVENGTQMQAQSKGAMYIACLALTLHLQSTFITQT